LGIFACLCALCLGHVCVLPDKSSAVPLREISLVNSGKCQR
jgi:hypothetical protein